MVIAQAMAAGKAVVASAVGGVPELVVDGETGYLVSTDDELQFADRMGKLLSDVTLRSRMGRQAREAACARCLPDVVAERTMDAYRSLLRF